MAVRLQVPPVMLKKYENNHHKTTSRRNIETQKSGRVPITECQQSIEVYGWKRWCPEAIQKKAINQNYGGLVLAAVDTRTTLFTIYFLQNTCI